MQTAAIILLIFAGIAAVETFVDRNEW